MYSCEVGSLRDQQKLFRTIAAAHAMLALLFLVLLQHSCALEDQILQNKMVEFTPTDTHSNTKARINMPEKLTMQQELLDAAGEHCRGMSLAVKSFEETEDTLLFLTARASMLEDKILKVKYRSLGF